jgi:Tol biopolymer transport system component/DNA-binding winged helix-turn-helix (wHTH) protein
LRTKLIYEFGPYSLDTAERVLRRRGQIVPLAPKALETLLVLIERSGNVVSRAELMERVWPGTFVEEQNLTFNISVLRKTLGEEDGAPYIETVPKRGYRFVPDVKVRQLTLEDPGSANQPRTIELGSVQVAGERAIHLAPTSPPAVSDHEPIKGFDEHESASNGANTTEAPPNLAYHPTNSGQDRAIAQTTLSGQVKKRAILLVTALGLLIVAFIVGWMRSFKDRSDLIPSFQTMQITRLTALGNVREAAISPDGKYVVYVTEASGQQSLWLKHIPTLSDVQIAPSTAESYQNLAFSPEGDQIYFTKGAHSVPSPLYRIPVLGGSPQKLTENVMSRITFSPDGRRMAFVRTFPSGDKDALITANTDGSDEKILVIKGPNETLSPATPAWSPDGKVIACGIMDIKKNEMTIFGVSAADGTERHITSYRWFRVEKIAWAPDGQGLIAVATPQKRFFYQLWYVPIEGSPYRITNDLNNYNGVSVAAEANAIVTVRLEQQSSLWVINPAEGAINAKRLTFRADVFDGGNGVAWTRDGRIIYTSNANGDDDLWITSADGSDQHPLTKRARVNWQPTVSPDGRYVAFLSDRAGAPHIWRLDFESKEAVQLTHGQGESNPTFSPDGSWLIYAGIAANKYVIWKARADGSQAQQLTKHSSIRPTVSPDGRWIAYWYQDDQPNSPWRIAIIPIEGGVPIKIFDLPPSAAHRGFFGGFFFRARWSPDGTSISYIDEKDGVSNIWAQPLDGGPPRRLTDFTSNLIFDFDWSPDGERLVCSRGMEKSDVVLISFTR